MLTLRWARAKVAHLRAQLPPLPEGLAFSRLHFSPGDNYLLLLLDSPAERFQLPGGAQSVPVCVVDLKEQRLTTWQVRLLVSRAAGFEWCKPGCPDLQSAGSQLPEGAQCVPVCMVDLKEQRLTTRWARCLLDKATSGCPCLQRLRGQGAAG